MARKKPKPAPKRATEPTPEEVMRAVVAWSARLESTLTALLAMLDQAKAEVKADGSPWAEHFRPYDLEDVHQSISSAWCMCCNLRPQNPLLLEFPSPGDILAGRTGA